MISETITVGIDVGGERKGFHAVALRNGVYAAHISTKHVKELAHWCRETNSAQVIAVDAPCRWSKDGRARPAERELLQQRISCFSSPTYAQALAHPSNYFGWMLLGAELYAELEKDFPLCHKMPTANAKCCFETFPHAIAWHLRGGNADASQKRSQRRTLLALAGIDLTHLSNIDLIDAALCALTAFHVARGKPCLMFGEVETGFIIVPEQSPLPER